MKSRAFLTLALTALVLSGGIACARANRPYASAAQYPLNHAVVFEPEAVEGLLAEGSDVNALNEGGQTPLQSAAGVLVLNRGSKTIDTLLRAGANPNAGNPDNSPLRLAIGRGASETEKFELVSLLLEAGADPNAEGAFGDLIIFQTFSDRNLKLVKVMLEAGADPNQPMLFDWVVTRQQTKMIELFLEAGADPNAYWGSTSVLHIAISHGFSDISELLLNQENIDVNAATRDDRGVTPLYLALQGRDVDAVKLLLEHGADPQLTTGYGVTPYQFVEKYSDNPIRALFGLGPVDRPHGCETTARS